MAARRTPSLHRILRRARRSRLVIGSLALGAALATRGVIVRAEAERARWGTSAEIVVVRRHLAAGSTIRAADLERRRLPVAVVPDGATAASAAGELLGRRVAADLEAGDQLIAARLAGHRSAIAAQLRSGEAAVMLPIGSVRPSVQRNDAVTVVVPAANGRPSDVAGRVLTVSSSAVTVAVAERFATSLASAALLGPVAIVVR